MVFPAGGISTSPDKFGRQPATDAPWQPFVSQLVEKSRATVLPLYFDGQNSRLFQIVSHLSLTLRLALIFKEVKARMGTTLAVSVGEPIPFDDSRSPAQGAGAGAAPAHLCAGPGGLHRQQGACPWLERHDALR